MSVLTEITDEAFRTLVEPMRRELLAHCYRMMGSAHDAEDLLQETFLRAWRGLHGFDERASLRTWMYRIATNTCLTALEQRARRPLPTGLGAPAGDPSAELRTREIAWLEPMPDAMLWTRAPEDPAEQAVSRDSVRLAFVAALQHLTAQQRAALLLRDVLAWQASEVAALLGVSVAAVNSSLQRARAHLARLEADPAPSAPDDPRTAALLEQYVQAFEDYDVERIVSLLAEDAVWEMPPYDEWYQGARDIGRLISLRCPAQGPGDMRTLMTGANGAPVMAVYMAGDDGVHRAFQLQHVTVVDGRVRSVTVWFDQGLFAQFGLPLVLPAGR